MPCQFAGASKMPRTRSATSGGVFWWTWAITTLVTDMYDPQSPLAEEHVALARSADALLVAPASATTIARFAHGISPAAPRGAAAFLQRD